MTDYKHIETAKEPPLSIWDIIGSALIFSWIISLAFLPNMRSFFWG